MPPASYHVVHYRSFKVPEGLAGTLETLCRDALGELADGKTLWLRPEDRIMSVKEEDRPARNFLMNRVADLNDAVFGEICMTSDGDLQAMLRMMPQTRALTKVTETAFYDLSERQAPDGDRFIRGLGFWYAINDHLFLVTLQSIMAKHIMAYLVWLMQRTTGASAVTLSEQAFSLELDASVIGPDSVGKVRKLVIRGNSPVGVAVDVGDVVETDGKSDVRQRSRSVSRTVGAVHAVHDRAVAILHAALGPVRAKSLIEALGPEEYFTAEASIRVKGKKTEATLANVKKIAQAIADETDAHVEVEGSMGKIKDGDAILRLRMPFQTGNEGGTLLDFDNVADQIREVYRRFVQDGKIRS